MNIYTLSIIDSLQKYIGLYPLFNYPRRCIALLTLSTIKKKWKQSKKYNWKESTKTEGLDKPLIIT